MLRPLQRLLATARAEEFLRGFGLFMGLFITLSVILKVGFNSLDPNVWWIDLRGMPEFFQTIFLLCVSIGLCLASLKTELSSSEKTILKAVFGLCAMATFANGLDFYNLERSGRIHARAAIPLSWIVSGLLLLWMGRLGLADAKRGKAHLAAGWVFFFLCIGPIAQMLFFGTTDYRREADVIVVFGARARADGRPSDALADRIYTAIALYKESRAEKMIFSGGPGDGEFDEPEVMKRIALRNGVPESAIILDPQGLNTEASVSNVLKLPQGAGRLIVVSHFYHLPRIKLAFQARGKDVLTVPAKSPRFLARLPIFMAREVAACWVYFVRTPLAARNG